ncbi:MAG: hypothetical protein ABWY25_07405 [Paenisporosarcina sp.]
MATVTGFTAERMLAIENTTVVDGEVQGDNLILLQRDGTPIDAGNVRGPQGNPGPAGGVTNVNDQTGAVYSPRIFTNKAAVDSGWATAPQAAVASTVSDKTIWLKDSTGWFTNNGMRVFASTAERDSRWPNAPDGSVCQAPSGMHWTKVGSSWSPTSRWSKTYERYANGVYIDQFLTIDMQDDSGTWPVESTVKITAVVQATGWRTGFKPYAELYSNTISWPWYPANGYGYDDRYATKDFLAENVGGGSARPLKIGSLNGIQHLAAGASTINWTIRCYLHDGAGAIAVNYGLNAFLTRTPRTPKTT